MSSSHNISLAGSAADQLSTQQKIAAFIGFTGLFVIVLSLFNQDWLNSGMYLTIALGAIFGGIIWYSYASYQNTHEGVKNNFVQLNGLTSRGLWAYLLGLGLTGFYIILYFYPDLIGLNTKGDNTGIIAFFDPLSLLLSGNPASQWFVYGTLYTIAILGFGIKAMLKYKHNKYQQVRTFSVMFFQLGFAFIIPELMARLNTKSFKLPYYDLKNIWPLNYYNFEQYRVDEFISAGNIGLGLLIFGVASIFIITPILTYKYGKRWYCSWVCGCGGLAETAGDSFRHLSDKSTNAWRFERWLIHLVTVFITISTIAVVYSYLGDDTSKYWLTKSSFLIIVVSILSIVFGAIMIFKRQEIKKDATYSAIGFFVIIVGLISMHFIYGAQQNLFLIEAESLRSGYGFMIGSIFSGVIGTGFYPIFGNRVWCRFGCPMAAILGLQQRLFSKFRITTNGGQCISCGNCSTYCEMGIDVRAYAQKGENIVRSSCVGCGICANVCPRGVLKLENDSLDNRINSEDILLGNDVNLKDYLQKD